MSALPSPLKSPVPTTVQVVGTLPSAFSDGKPVGMMHDHSLAPINWSSDCSGCTPRVCYYTGYWQAGGEARLGGVVR
jgi:hypothetical protein